MGQGDLSNAVGGYREALQLLPNIAVGAAGVTTLWGLAVALDRSGDHRRALDHIDLARSYDRDDRQLRHQSWFFMPSYDEHWYAALGHWARARAATGPSARAEAYGRAIASWHAYLSEAHAGDRWLPLGERRLEQCERESRQTTPDKRGVGNAPLGFR
jgi:cytochrome c-type biogenesis protein CcmH/NrfG